jgi:hypothetical protein
MRPLRYLPLVVSALCAMLAAHMAWRDPRYLVPFFLIAALTFMPAVISRWRMRRLLMSGDPKRVLGTWEGSIERIMYPETMAPLMAATAYASYGWIEAARSALSRAVKGPAWEAALEQRLFVETLLDTFEGERDAAMQKAAVLEKMPIPPAGPFTRNRIAALRRGLAALARAFAHQATDADAKVLERAAVVSPLVHWAMRYARAIIAVDSGKTTEVSELLAGAPEWPKESAFHVYHQELLAQANQA